MIAFLVVLLILVGGFIAYAFTVGVVNGVLVRIYGDGEDDFRMLAAAWPLSLPLAGLVIACMFVANTTSRWIAGKR